MTCKTNLFNIQRLRLKELKDRLQTVTNNLRDLTQRFTDLEENITLQIMQTLLS